jgi:multicomponent Na+:H+ antiporter subunit D
MTSSGAISLQAFAVLIPLVCACSILILRHRPNLREAASLVSALALFLCLLPLASVVTAGDRPAVELLEFVPGVSFALHAEPLGVGFALIVSLLWFITVLYSIGYMRLHDPQHLTRFYVFMALAVGATVGAAFSANLLTLYLFYEGLTLATYPLVTHGQRSKDRAGGHVYVVWLLGTSLVLLLAIAWIYSLTGSLDFVEGGILRDGGELIDGLTPVLLSVIFGLFLFGTGKAALMPFHRWLPAAMVAPTPVSALLHAVAVVKLGVFSIVKAAVYIFGIDLLADTAGVSVMQYVAAVTLLAAAMLALREDSMKRRLAYSTISQLAYVVLGVTLANDLSVTGSGFHIAAHAFAKITLFFCAGLIMLTLGKTMVSELRGIARHMPVTVGAWLVASLCIIGLPLTGGFWSKWYLAHGAWSAGQPLFLGVMLVGSLLAMGYLLPPAIRAFYAPPTGVSATDSSLVVREAPPSTLLAVGMSATLTVLLFFAVQPVLDYLGNAFE